MGILDSYDSEVQPRSLHTNDISAQSDWPLLAQLMGMSVTSRDSSLDGFRSFGNKIPKLMKMASSEGSGKNFPKLSDSYSEAVGFLGGCSVAQPSS